MENVFHNLYLQDTPLSNNCQSFLLCFLRIRSIALQKGFPPLQQNPLKYLITGPVTFNHTYHILL